MRGWQETGHIEVDEGYCELNACGNHNYLTACGELLKLRAGIKGMKECPNCRKPLMTVEEEG
jgi:hypothetical protein